MPDEFTRGGRIRKPQTGAYNNTWGSVLNVDVMELFDDLVSGIQDITLTGLAYSMPALEDGVDSDSRAMVWRFLGSPSGAVTVTLPATILQKIAAIDNQCGQAITFTYGGGGSTSTVNAGLRRFLMCDGTNVRNFDGGADATTLGGVDAANYARRDVANSFAKTNRSPWIDVTEAPSTTIDAGAGNHQRLTLTGNRAIAAPSGVADGQSIVLQVVQDASGGRTLTWDSVFLFENGTPPTLSSAANARDLFVMYYDAAATRWIVGHFGGLASSGGAGFNYTISGCQTDVNLLALLGSVGGPVTVNLTIAQGAVLQAGSTRSFGLDCASSLPSGSVLNIFNNGYILGRGGRGGDGGSMYDQGSGLGNGENRMHSDGRDGGGALRAPGGGVTCNITNNGYIWGGGGGGGGGLGSSPSAGVGTGGGGGGGTGGGLGGVRGAVNGLSAAVDGSDGGSGVFGTAGTGGAGGVASGGGTSGTGGNGGDWGTAGDAAGGGGLGGGAGKAVELNGGTVNFLAGSGAPNIKGAVS